MEIVHIVPRYLPAVSGEAVALHSIAKRLAQKGHKVKVYTTNAIDATAMYSSQGRVVDRNFEVIDGVEVHRFPVNYKFLAKFKGVVNKNRFLYSTDEIYEYIDQIKEKIMSESGLNNLITKIFLSPLIARLFVPRAPISNKLLKNILRENPDLYHVHGIPTSSPIYGYIAAKKTKKPLIIKLAFHPSDKLYYSPLTFKILNEADAIIGNTTADIDILSKFGISKEKITITGDGIDLSNYLKPKSSDLNAFREKYKLHEYEGVVFFLGRLQREKGVFNVIDAVIQINKENRGNIKLLIAGPKYENSSSIIKEYERKYEFITYLGTISEKEKIIALHSSDILAVPSIVESFGIIYIEAWACKKPVIGADIPSTRALISYGEDGFYVKFGDIKSLAEKIEYLIENEKEKKEMGKTGFNKVKANYTEDIVFGKVHDVYQRVMGD